jgi:glucose-1-phosphate cytidylyltransferase
MKTVILCGGFGTRLSEETILKPKPMVEIGSKPILWHIMKIYEKYNFKDFVLALGYKGEYIKDYFLNYHARNSNLRVNLLSGDVSFLNQSSEDWSVSCIDTGSLSMTGGRLLNLKSHLEYEDCFCLTYGDGLANINVKDLVKFHKSHGKIATVTVVRPPVRFGELKIMNKKVIDFQEKPQAGEGWINGGYFVFSPRIFSYITNNETMLEREPLENLVNDGELMSYEHNGFWQCMDTMRDKQTLEDHWKSGNPPWMRD